MKKIKIFAGMIGAVAIAGAVAFNINAGLKSGKLSDIALANVEALARGEGGSSGEFKCYSTFSNCWFWNCSTIYRCGNPCTDASADSYSDQGTCSN